MNLTEFFQIYDAQFDRRKNQGFAERTEYGKQGFGPLASEGGSCIEEPLRRMCVNKERTATCEITRIAPPDEIIDVGRNGMMTKRNFFVLRKGILVTRVFNVLNKVEGRAR